MSKPFGGLLLLCLLCAPSVWADPVDDYVTAQMREQHIPGLSVAIVRDGRIVKAQGYGLANVELNAPATPETVYHLASLTKQFTAAAVLLLAQDGKIGLDDKIGRYLEPTPANWREVTVRQLLGHTSGIKDYLNEMQSATRSGTSPEEIVAGLGQMPLNFTPGSHSYYSNTGYLVLGMIVQKVSGKSYDAFLAERIFKPLGMSATRRNSLEEIVPHRAAGYLWVNGKLVNSPFLDPTLYDNADAGLVSTVLDLARWDVALYGDSLLKASTRERMWAPVKLADGSTRPYAFGWNLDEVNGHRLVTHAGNRDDTSTSIVRYLDDKLTVIVLANLGRANADRIARHLAGLYVPALLPGTEKSAEDREPRVTDLVKSVLLKVQDGTIDPAPFTPDMWKGFHPQATSYLQHLLGSAGPFQSITLLSRQEQGESRLYRYRAVFGSTRLIFDVTLTPKDKISEMGVSPE
jgi:CubicO group peptidase (beta-lactamase class C family)